MQERIVNVLIDNSSTVETSAEIACAPVDQGRSGPSQLTGHSEIEDAASPSGPEVGF